MSVQESRKQLAETEKTEIGSMHTNLFAVRAGIELRNVIETAADKAPILAGLSLRLKTVRVRCSSVETLDQIMDEFEVEAVTKARLTVDKSFNILMREDDDVRDKSAERDAQRSTLVDFVDGRSAREGKLLLEESNDLIDSNILQTRDVVFVAEDVELSHQVPVGPRCERRVVGTRAVAADFVIGDPADEPELRRSD